MTELVQSTRRMLRDMRPNAQLTAAVFPSAKSRERVLQDAESWLRRGLVDAVFPMTYDDSDAGFRDAIEEGYGLFRAAGTKAVCLPGVGAYKHKTAEQTARQLGMCRGGFALFSYSSLYVSPDETRRENEKLCRARRDAVRKFLSKATANLR
ncbi:MAG: hypothetical protein HY293_02140 [Planctomycetes bacterium]|nr:hypothetical protein [Planctomycetota bacterium]